MKTLEEIENLSIEELEQKAAEHAAPVPDGLERRLRQALAAREIADAARPRPVHWIPYASLAAAAAAAALIILPQRGPKDTFDDPLLAYAEVEKTFRIISDKMSVGLDIVRDAETTADMPTNTLNKIQK
jgi:hypothetical protein